MSRASYYLRRTVITIILIYIVATALFLLFRLMPGSYIDLVAQAGAGSAEIEELEKRWNLDGPIYVQYYTYLVQLLSGDMGTSIRYGVPVQNVVGPAMLNSIILIAPAISVAYLIGSFAGLIMGHLRDSRFEKWGVILVTVTGTIPVFFLGIIFVVIFSSWLNIFPTSGMLSSTTQAELGENPSIFTLIQTGEFWLHYVLPFTTIVARFLFIPSLIMRTSVIEVSGQGFMTFHRMTGLRRWNRLFYQMKHASLPVITLFPVSMTRAIGGMVLVEVVFNWPGIGFLLVESVHSRDYPIVQTVFFIAAVWIILANYVVDIIYGVIDPRVSVEEE